MKAKVTFLCLLAVIMGYGPALSALEFDLNTPFTDTAIGPPIGSAWLSATFDDVAADSVQLTLSAAGLPSGSYVTQWYFNISDTPEIAKPKQLGLATDPQLQDFLLNFSGDLSAGTSEFGKGFNILMTFSSTGDDLFKSPDTAIFLFSYPGIIAEWFNQLNMAGNFYAAANALSVSGESWIAATSATTPGPCPGPSPIPEPATVILLGCGMVGLTFFGRKKFFA